MRITRRGSDSGQSTMNSSPQGKERSMRFRHALVLVIASLYGPAIADTIYKCRDENGVIVFSQSPCGETPDKIEIQEYKKPETIERQETEKSTGEPLQTPRDYNEELRERLKARKWKQREQSLLNRIKALELERDRQIKKINEELRESWDHQENRTRRMRIHAIKDEYRWRIDGAQRELRNHWATKK